MKTEDRKPKPRAFLCWVPDLGIPPMDGGGLYRSTSASKARYLCLLSWRDAGYRTTDFGRIRVKRAPAYDQARFRDGTQPRFVGAS